MNPPVSGMPAMLSRKIVISTPNSGFRRPRPAQAAKLVASVPDRRTKVSTAKAATVARP